MAMALSQVGSASINSPYNWSCCLLDQCPGLLTSFLPLNHIDCWSFLSLHSVFCNLQGCVQSGLCGCCIEMMHHTRFSGVANMAENSAWLCSSFHKISCLGYRRRGWFHQIAHLRQRLPCHALLLKWKECVFRLCFGTACLGFCLLGITGIDPDMSLCRLCQKNKIMDRTSNFDSRWLAWRVALCSYYRGSTGQVNIQTLNEFGSKNSHYDKDFSNIFLKSNNWLI